MIDKKSWEEFRSTGLLWFINTFLHAFGWAICVELDDDGNVVDSYPARVKFRGFAEENNDKGYQSITKYMAENATELLEDVMEG